MRIGATSCARLDDPAEDQQQACIADLPLIDMRLAVAVVGHLTNGLVQAKPKSIKRTAEAEKKAPASKVSQTC